VNVAELQQLLVSVGQILTAAGSKAATELDYLNQKLTPFKEQKLKAFADAIEKAHRPLPFPSVDVALTAIRLLYEKATSPELTEESIEAEVNRCEKLTKPQLDDLAKRFGMERKFSKKDQTLKAIRQKIIDRKGAVDRAGA
jgi:hypothetical protein